MCVLRLLLALALAGLTAGAGALSGDRDQPIRIDSDRAQLDNQRRVAVYEGNVVLLQGSLRITGDVVTMHFNEGYDLSILISEGSPTRFQQQLDSGEVQEGRADRIEYRTGSGAMTFVGEARIAQGQFKMKAHRLEYDSVSGSIKGVSGDVGPGGSRVTLTVQPASGESR